MIKVYKLQTDMNLNTKYTLIASAICSDEFYSKMIERILECKKNIKWGQMMVVPSLFILRLVVKQHSIKILIQSDRFCW